MPGILRILRATRLQKKFEKRLQKYVRNAPIDLSSNRHQLILKNLGEPHFDEITTWDMGVLVYF